MDQDQFYYSNGKLLITAEYLVLKGALTLAVPTQYGQSLTVYPNTEKGLKWQAFENKKEWLKFDLSLDEILKPKAGNLPEKDFVAELLNHAIDLNSQFRDELSYRIKTHLNFNRNWGLGSSSTLINNVAQWAKVDAFELLGRVSQASGYDIACAQNNTPILFQRIENKAQITPCVFSPEFKDQIYFLYLGKKQKSEKEVIRFLAQEKGHKEEIQAISALSLQLLETRSAVDFDKIITEHERITSGLLGQPCLKQLAFADFEGAIKSLGAWGGDFAMLRSDWDKNTIQNYFDSKSLNTIIPWENMVLMDESDS